MPHADPSRPRLPARDPLGHKGTFGTVCVVGGCVGGGGPTMVGGPALAAIAALRVGAGLAKLAMPPWLLPAALVIAPSATGLPISDAGSVECDAFVVGPALGQRDGLVELLAPVLAGDTPVVIDADALNLIASDPGGLSIEAPAVLTPHVGEFRKLAQALRVGAPEPTDDPAAAASALAQASGRVVVLKSSTTVVAHADRAWTHNAANPALATGGAGDVLAGVIAGLIAQFGEHRAEEGVPTLPLFDLACLGVAAHARAGAAWRDDHRADAGMLATDLLDELPGAIASMR